MLRIVNCFKETLLELVKTDYSAKPCGMKENHENNYSGVIGGSVLGQPYRLKFTILNCKWQSIVS